jgi:hypothetical protein
METQIPNNAKIKFAQCPYCSAEISLSSDNIDSKTYFCTNCKRENVIWDLRDDYFIDHPKQSSTFWEFFGFVSAVVSFFLFPPAFGVLGVFCGYKTFRKGAHVVGGFIVVLTITLVILGLAFNHSIP